MQIYKRGVLVLVVLLLAGAVVAIPGLVRAQGPTLEPEVTSVEAGSTIRFFARSFTPRERIAWWATAPDQAVVGGNPVWASRSNGDAEIDFRVPDDAIGGQWAMSARGETSGALLIVTFEVIGRELGPEEFVSKVAPESGPPGTVFAFAATGYDDEETVSYWVTGPDGTIFEAFPEGAEADEDGRLDINWQAPANAQRGFWAMTMQGYDSSVVRGVGFEVR